MAAGPGAITPIDDWRSCFAAAHRQWGRHKAAEPYTRDDKRVWGQLLEFLESRARADGYDPARAAREELARQRRNDDDHPPDRPRLIKSRRK